MGLTLNLARLLCRNLPSILDLKLRNTAVCPRYRRLRLFYSTPDLVNCLRRLVACMGHSNWIKVGPLLLSILLMPRLFRTHITNRVSTCNSHRLRRTRQVRRLTCIRTTCHSTESLVNFTFIYSVALMLGNLYNVVDCH